MLDSLKKALGLGGGGGKDAAAELAECQAALAGLGRLAGALHANLEVEISARRSDLILLVLAAGGVVRISNETLESARAWEEGGDVEIKTEEDGGLTLSLVMSPEPVCATE